MPTPAIYAIRHHRFVVVFIIAFSSALCTGRRSRREISSAEEEAKRIINESIKVQKQNVKLSWRQKKKYTKTAANTNAK